MDLASRWVTARVVAPDKRNERIETILVLLSRFLWLQCPDEMNCFDEGLECPDPGEPLAKTMCCLAALAAERATMRACEGAGDAAPRFSSRGPQHHFVLS